MREKLNFNNKTFFKSEIKFSQAKFFFEAAKKNILVFVITFKEKGKNRGLRRVGI